MSQITININDIDFLQRCSLQEKETSESTALNQACPEGFFFFFLDHLRVAPRLK